MTAQKFSGKCFILYDGRAKSGDTDDASVLVTAHSEREARHDSQNWSGYDAIWYEYDVRDGRVINEKVRWDIAVRP